MKEETGINTIVLGTENPAKKALIQLVLDSLGVDLFVPSDFGLCLDIDEDSTSPQENARRKACTYAQKLRRVVLSVDIALYFDGVSSDEQPGTHIRRITSRNHRPLDEEVLSFFSERIKKAGGECEGSWVFGFCLANEQGVIIESTITKRSRFVAEPSTTIVLGHPLASLEVDFTTKCYISEMTIDELAQLWKDSIGNEVEAFLLKAFALLHNHETP